MFELQISLGKAKIDKLSVKCGWCGWLVTEVSRKGKLWDGKIF